MCSSRLTRSPARRRAAPRSAAAARGCPSRTAAPERRFPTCRDSRSARGGRAGRHRPVRMTRAAGREWETRRPTPVTEPAQPPTPPDAPPDAETLLRSRAYVALLVFGAAVGVPVAAVAFFFLKAISESQHYFFSTLPGELGLRLRADVVARAAARRWPACSSALTIRYLPGTAGHKPAEGFKTGLARPIDLPGIVLAAFFTLSLGVVLGPEAPLLAIGGGLGVLILHLVKKDAPAQATMVIGAAGSFAAISTLLGSPLPAAFLMMEVAGLGGPMLGVVLVPGLLAAGIGSLIFVGLDAWTGFGTFSLAVPNLPSVGTPTGAEFLWAIAIGLDRRRARPGDPTAGAVPAADRRAADAAADAGGRPRRRRPGDRLRRGLRPQLVGGALLRPGSAARR